MQSDPTTLQERVHSSSPPAGWSLNKLHRVLRVRKGFKNTGMQEDNLLSLSYGRIVHKSIDATEGLLPESFETYQIVEPGNIVMRLTDLQNDKRSLRQGLVKERGIITSAYDALELKRGHDPRFWAYALLALDLAKYYYSLGGGVRQSIKFSDFPNDWISTPDSDTQKAIADFLDRETTRIDQLIEKKQRLGLLLKEAWKATLSTEMDYSAHPKQRLKHLIKYGSSISYGIVQPGDPLDEGIPFIQTANLVQGKLEIDQLPKTHPDIAAKYPRSRLTTGDVLLGIRASIGHTIVIEKQLEGANLSRGIAKISPGSNITSEYLCLSLQTEETANFWGLVQQGSTFREISIEAVRELPISLPEINIQMMICEKASAWRMKNEKIVSFVESSVKKLHEFRSALITAAVTGQIDVATWGKQGQTDRRLDEIEEAMQV